MTGSSNKLGKYQILREIARSNDVVYEAIDPVVGRHIALKELVFPPNLTGVQRTERIQRFYREAKAAGTLAHPNIVTIYDVGEDNGRHYIAMEYLEGQTLRDILRVRGTLPVAESVRICIELCKALGYAHEHGIVHRDVKPDNIYVLPDGRVKLADFGIARLTMEPSLTANGQVFGTPSYMSPEQVAGRTVDGRTDLFSLGVVLYEMLTDTKPFTGDSIVTITYNIINTYPELPPHIPMNLASALQRSMSKNPNDRFQNAQEMIEALLNPGSVSPVPAASVSTVSPQNLPNTQGIPAATGTVPASQITPGSPPTTAVNPSKLVRARKYQARIWSAILVSIIIGFVWLCYWAFTTSFHNYNAQQSFNIGMRQANQAAELFQAQRYDESISTMQQALTNFDQAIKADPRGRVGSTARKNAAMVSVGIGRIILQNTPTQVDGAIQSFQKAIAYNPQSSEAYSEIGNIYGRRAYAFQNLSDVDNALDNWERAISFNIGSQTSRNTAESYANLCYYIGVILWRQGNSDKARDYWNRAISHAGGTPSAAKCEQLLTQPNQ